MQSSRKKNFIEVSLLICKWARENIYDKGVHRFSKVFLHHISTLSRLECIQHIVWVSEFCWVETSLLTDKWEILLRSRIEMDHMREDYWHDSEILWEENESLITNRHLRCSLDHTAILRSKCIDSDMNMSKVLARLETRCEPTILETEHRHIDSLIDGILLLTLDTTRWCYHSSVHIERDEYRLSSRHKWEYICWDIWLCDDAFLVDVCFESFSDELMHNEMIIFGIVLFLLVFHSPWPLVLHEQIHLRSDQIQSPHRCGSNKTW